MPFSSVLRSVCFLFTLMLGLTVQGGVAFSQEAFSWQFNEGNDPSNKGRATARLVYGIPETDAAQIIATCDGAASTSSQFSSVTFGADIGALKEGATVSLRFSGGGYSNEIKGQVHGTLAETGITGVLVDLKHDDALWEALTGKERLSYFVPGYNASSVELGKGRPFIKQFIETCRAYGNSSVSKVANTPSSITEKEAFESAKELNTIEGWEAFLNNYSTGFRADLARAYVKRLAGNPAGQEKIESPDSKPPVTPQSKVKQPTLSMLNMGEANSSWFTGRQMIAREGLSLHTARVRARGVELVTYCKDNNMSGGLGYRLGAIIRQLSPGSYPQFYERAQQGIESAIKRQDNGAPRIDVWFSDGDGLPNAVADYGVANGEFGIGSISHGFPVNSEAVERMMASRSMHVTLPPFGATFQLKGSRKAICSMMKRCGALPAGCPGAKAAPYVKPGVNTRRKCTKGRIYISSQNQGKCVCPRGTTFRQGRCRKIIWKNKCPAFHERVKGKCVRNDEVNNPHDDGCGPGFKLVKGKCVSRYSPPKLKIKVKKKWKNKCPAFHERVKGKCVRNDEVNNPHDDGCGPGFKLVKGKCISRYSPPKPKVKLKKKVWGVGNAPPSCRCPGCLWNGKTCKRSKAPAPGQLSIGGQKQIKQKTPQKKPVVQQGACSHGRIRNGAGHCVCPSGTQKIGGKCVNVQQLQKGLQQILSDRRLKRDIRPIATLQNGLQLYSYRYVWDNVFYVGVMAQDLLKQANFKHAVHMTSEGIYVVDYKKLGLKGSPLLKDWRADMMEATFIQK